MKWKQFLAFHTFEAAYLAALAVLPFIVRIPLISFLLLLFFLVCVIVGLVRKFLWKTITVSGQGIVITGCDTGFGHALAKRLDHLGFTVIAGCLDANGEGASALRSWSSSIHVVSLNVTSEESVRNAVEFAKKICKNGIWAVVNNAAVNYLGDVEFCTMDQYKYVAEVNQFGVIRVTKAFLPFLRESGGRVVNVTSAKGRISLPCNSVYGATKYAVEAFSDVLRLEMFKFGVKVVIVEPGDFGGTTGMLSAKTLKWMRSEMDTMWDSASNEVRKTYGKEYLEAEFTGAKEAAKEAAKSTAPVIDAMEDAVTNIHPKIRYLVDGSCKIIDLNNWFIRLKSILPESWIDVLVDMKHNQGLPKVATIR